MKILSLHLAMVFVLYGCSTMTPPRYALSADTNQLLKQFRGKKAVLTELAAAASYDPTCRLMGGRKGVGSLFLTGKLLVR